MPSRITSAIESSQTVLVTGANGFIAQHCIAALLRQHYHVVGTVRSEDKASSVRRVHSSHPRLDVVIVEDITSPDTYVTRLHDKQPNAIIHLAAPFTYATNNYERDLMIPTVKGATAILQAAVRIPSVRRVVQTNSFAGIYDASAGLCPEKVYTARDWSPLTYKDGVEATNAPTAYRASKTAAERAAWDFMRSHNPQFDLVSLCPAMVFGAFLPGAIPSSAGDLNTSNTLVNAVLSAGRDAPVPPTKGPVWVDVRDVADAHVRSLTTPEAGGRRFLLAAGVYCNQELADTAQSVVAEAVPKMLAKIPIGEPGKRESHMHFGVDARETEEVLGMEWKTLSNCLRELAPQLYQMS